MIFALALALIVLGTVLAVFSGRWRRGRTPKSRWWVRRTKVGQGDWIQQGLVETMALLGAPLVAAMSITAGAGALFGAALSESGVPAEPRDILMICGAIFGFMLSAAVPGVVIFAACGYTSFAGVVDRARLAVSKPWLLPRWLRPYRRYDRALALDTVNPRPERPRLTDDERTLAVASPPAPADPRNARRSDAT